MLSALATFVGWTFEIGRLIDWFGLGVTMKANAAIALFTIGLGLVLFAVHERATPVSRVCAIAAISIGGATLFQHISGIDLGIDTLLFEEPRGALGTASPGRMGPPASTSFVLLGAALLLLPRRQGISVAMALFVLGIAALSLVGYGYGAEVMYIVPRLTGISLQMALFLAVTSLGIVTSAHRSVPVSVFLEGGTARTLAARLIPAAVLIPIATGWLRLVGQRAGYYDTEFGVAMRTIVEMVLFAALAWWAVSAIRMRDIRRQRAEKERDLIERKFRAVIDASAVPFTVLEPVRGADGRIADFRWAYLNSAAAAAIGRPIQDLTGREVNLMLPGSWEEPGVFERYVSVADRKAVEVFELNSRANGKEGWYQVVASPFDDHVAVWFSDVSERKRHEIALRDADRRKDEFLATLAHELRNPLAPIRQASLLSRKPALNEAQRQWCNEVIERQIQHMSLLLDDLLDVSRITRGMLELRRQHTSVQSVIQAGIETARPIIESKKHQLHVAIPDQDAIVHVDALRLSQVVANLLNNAAKYTDREGEIRLEVRVEADSLNLRVSDTGIGLAAEHLDEIFEMFAQVKSAHERSEGGLGIGLALSRGIVELHGGRIEAQSSGLGAGSTFHVYLPDVVVAVRHGHESADASPGGSIPLRILIADDNRDAADSLALLLGNDGHEVRVVYDGEAAINATPEFKPDVALLDLGMPRFTGYEVAKILRARAAECPLLIALTGWGQKSDRDRSMEAGFAHHLTKPIEYSSLVNVLHQVSAGDTSERSAGSTRAASVQRNNPPR